MLTILKVSESALRTQNEEPSTGNICKNGGRAKVPNQWVADEVDLTVIFDPEVLERSDEKMHRRLTRATELTMPRRRFSHDCGRESYV